MKAAVHTPHSRLSSEATCLTEMVSVSMEFTVFILRDCGNNDVRGDRLSKSDLAERPERSIPTVDARTELNTPPELRCLPGQPLRGRVRRDSE